MSRKRAGILGRLCKLAPPGKSKFSRRSLLTKIRLSLHPNSSSLFTPRFRLCITFKFRLILTLEICLNSPIKAGIMPCIHSYFNYRYTKDKKERNQNSLIIYLHSLKKGQVHIVHGNHTNYTNNSNSKFLHFTLTVCSSSTSRMST